MPGPETAVAHLHAGRYVAFMSSATNLVPGDTNGQNDILSVVR
jgi:hypothetical protein